MTKTVLRPEVPQAKQLHIFHQMDAKWAGFHGDTLVLGDSRADRYPRGEVASALGEPVSQVADWGVNGAQTREVWWMINHWSTDISHVDKIIIPAFGGNDLSKTDLGGHDIARAEVKLIRDVLTKAAPGAQVLVTEEIEAGPKFFETHKHTMWTEPHRHELNDSMQHFAGATGLFDWRATPHDGAPPTDQDYWFPDQIHMKPLFYQDFINPVVEDVFAGHAAAAALDPDIWA